MLGTTLELVAMGLVKLDAEAPVEWDARSSVAIDC